MAGAQFLLVFVAVFVTMNIVHQGSALSSESPVKNFTDATEATNSTSNDGMSLKESTEFNTTSALVNLNVSSSNEISVSAPTIYPFVSNSSDSSPVPSEIDSNSTREPLVNHTQRLEFGTEINNKSVETNFTTFVPLLEIDHNSTASTLRHVTENDKLEFVEYNLTTSNPVNDELFTDVNSNTSDVNVTNNSSIIPPNVVETHINASEYSSNVVTVNSTLRQEDNVTFIPSNFTESTLDNITVSENFTLLPPFVNMPNNISAPTNQTVETEVVSNGTFSSIILDNFNNSHRETTDDNNVTSAWINSPAIFNTFTSSVSMTSADDNVSLSTLEPAYTDDDYTITTVPPQPWFLLQFAGNCTMAQEEFDEFEKDVRSHLLSRAGVPDQKVSINMFNCSKNFLLNVSVSAEFGNTMSQFFKKFDYANDSKVQINEETYFVNVLGSTGSNAFKQPPDIVLSSRHTDIEFVIYVALGSACAFLLVLAVLLVMCKYCRTKPYKGFDVSDVSNLNLRLEDYTLTRIPRPKSVYNEYCRSTSNDIERYCPLEEQSSQANGMVHPFDTSVVPLEDAPAKVEAESEEQGNTSAPKGNPSNHEYEEIDVNSVNSTENLHERKGLPPTKPPWGVDNASFAT